MGKSPTGITTSDWSRKAQVYKGLLTKHPAKVGFLIKGKRHVKSLCYLWPKLGRALTKNYIHEGVCSGWPLPNGRQKGAAIMGAPFGRRVSCAAPLSLFIFHFAMVAQN